LATGFVPQRTERRVLECLDTLGVGLEVWDDQGRLLFCNRMNDGLQEHNYITTGASPIIGEMKGRDPVPRTDGNVPHVLELADNRCLLVYEARSAQGYVAVARVDVSDWVQKERDLESRVRQLARDSATDGLTGLANRRHFDVVVSEEWHRAARSQTPLSLLMVDIDHFKKYNDHYGHLAGDHCLQQVAEVLERCARRAGDFVARFGGDEFVLLLPGGSLEDACETAQKCLNRMRQVSLPHAASPVSEFVTLSIGVASLVPQPSLTPTTMINAADAAMYRAKSGGRARYEIANQIDWEIADDTPRTQPAPL
jgi:diguanylate cyclase (GGDEF)-like protein